ncbi:hypothetical protein HanPI659440_Chr00c02g0707471 [Helianthus annuus]|nr:hypothetical protein HanPI659440_Chr00c02g0707471 [Helianthus annuus]
MSVNQSRGDKNEPPHYRRPGRFANRCGSGGGGGGTTGPSYAYYSGKSFKKVVSNAQGGYSNVNLGPSNSSSSGGRAPLNGAHVQPPLRGTPDASSIGGVVKPADASVQKTTPGLPKAQPSNAVLFSSGTFGSGSSTPVKGSDDACRAFPLQFGSISPSVINRMQARIDSLKATSSHGLDVPKQHLPRKDPL